MEKNLTIQLGQTVLEKLEKLLDCLESAKKWGTLDIFSKDLLPTLVKRRKLKKSEAIAEEARIALEKFRDSLVEHKNIEFKIDKIVDKTERIDYFLGIIGNIFVQNKIKLNINETKNFYSTINECVQELVSENE